LKAGGNERTDRRRMTQRRFTPSRGASANSRRADVGDRLAAKLRRSGHALADSSRAGLACRGGQRPPQRSQGEREGSGGAGPIGFDCSWTFASSRSILQTQLSSWIFDCGVWSSDSGLSSSSAHGPSATLPKMRQTFKAIIASPTPPLPGSSAHRCQMVRQVGYRSVCRHLFSRI
jgi:hypothetical protein